MISQAGWMNALTWAIQQDLITVDTARAIVITAHSSTPQELEQAVAVMPVKQMAADYEQRHRARGHYKQPRYKMAGAP